MNLRRHRSRSLSLSLARALFLSVRSCRKRWGFIGRFRVAASCASMRSSRASSAMRFQLQQRRRRGWRVRRGKGGVEEEDDDVSYDDTIFSPPLQTNTRARIEKKKKAEAEYYQNRSFLHSPHTTYTLDTSTTQTIGIRMVRFDMLLS